MKNAARNNHNSPDYMDKEDFNLRMNHYKKQYETLSDDEGSYIRTHDSGRSLNLHLINGFLRTKIASYVMNLTALQTSNRPIYMTRAGETQFINRGLIGGDSELTSGGIEFAKALGDFLQYDDSGFSCTSSGSSGSQHSRPSGGATEGKATPTSGFEYDFDNFGYARLCEGGSIFCLAVYVTRLWAGCFPEGLSMYGPPRCVPPAKPLPASSRTSKQRLRKGGTCDPLHFLC